MRFVVFAVLLLVARRANAGLSGQVSATGQGAALFGETPNGGTQQAASLLLQENLWLQYCGTPFGPSIAFIGAALQASNFNALATSGAMLSGRTASLDLSVGLLPRRATPLRLYARGTVSDGGPQVLPTLGGRESIAYGANLNLEPGEWLPGVRADFEEHRFTGLGATQPLGDLRRIAALSISRPLDRHHLALSGRFEQEQRALSGAWLGVTLSGAWTSPTHQMTLFGSTIERESTVALPGFPAAASEQLLRLDHAQRVGSGLSVTGFGRLGQARFASTSGSLGGLGLGASWKPLDSEDFVVSLGGDVSFTRADAGSGQAMGAQARAGYARGFGPIRASAFAGGGAQYCGCVGLATGVLSSAEVGASVATLGFEKVEARFDYRLAFVDAPAGRGGKRLEHHLLAFGRVRVGQRAEVMANVGYDDGFRDYIDLGSGQVASLHEQAFYAGANATLAVGQGSVSVDVRHARGSALIPNTPLVNGPPPTARALTSANVTALLPVKEGFDLTLGAQAAWTVLDDLRPLSTIAATAGLAARLGRIAITLQYQVARSDTQGLATTQHFLRLSLARPFELF